MIKAISKEYLVSSLKDFNSQVLSKTYQKKLANSNVLNKLNESENGLLTYNGEKVDTDVVWSDVSGKPFNTVDTNTLSTEGGVLKVVDSGENNVQSDWNETNTTSDAYIKNKPTIPTKVSDLENDNNYIYSIPEDYVTETELTSKNYVTKTYLEEQIANIDSLSRSIVTKVPTNDEASENVIYMLKVESATGNDKYQEYMKIDGTVQLIGDTSVDLSNYATTEYVDNAVSNVSIDLTGYATEKYVDNAISNIPSGGDVDLSNYYKKSETYSRTEVDNLIPDAIEGVSPTITENTNNNDTTYKLDITDANGKFTTPNLKGYDGKDGKSITSLVNDENNNVIVTFSDGTKQNIGKLHVDISADFLTEAGFGNLRYYNGHFQYYDNASSTWIDTSITPDNVYVMNMMPQPMQFIMAAFDTKSLKYKLKWLEPEDTIINGQVACVVDKVVIRRKLGSIPANENDGELAIELSRRDFGLYKNDYFVDNDLTPNLGDTYYYKAFPMSTTGFYNASTQNETGGILAKDYELYGFKLDQSESDPASMITYLEDNKGFRSAYRGYTADTFNYGDWLDAFFMKVRPCMLKYDGTVDYYLNPNDSTLKEDGTPSDVANVEYEGNAMVQFPKVYYKIVDNGDNSANIYISDKKVDEKFHTWTHTDANGNEIPYCYMPMYNGYNDGTRLRSLSGKTPMHSKTAPQEIELALANNPSGKNMWYTDVMCDRDLVNNLLLLIGKSTNTQAVFGNGYYTGGSQNSYPRINTGTMDTKGLFWGSNGSSRVGVKVFGMENWWGNQWRRLAGWINDHGAQKVKMTYGQSDGSTVDGYNTTGEGYIEIPNATPSGTSGGYISGMAFDEHGLIPKVASGSATTYYTDGLWFNNGQVDYAFVGGASNSGLLVGALSSDLNAAPSYAGWSVGAAVSCKPLA